MEIPRNEEPARLSPEPPPPRFLCLSYFFRLFSGAAAATLQTTNNFPFSSTWLFQILVRLYALTLPMPPPPQIPHPLPARHVAPRGQPTSFALPATCSQSYTLSNSSAFLLSLWFDAHIDVPVCQHMANGCTQRKEQGDTRTNVRVHPQ